MGLGRPAVVSEHSELQVSPQQCRSGRVRVKGRDARRTTHRAEGGVYGANCKDVWAVDIGVFRDDAAFQNDGAVPEQLPDAAAIAGGGLVVGNRAVVDGQCAAERVDREWAEQDASAVGGGRVSRDGTVADHDRGRCKRKAEYAAAKTGC